MRSVGFLVTVVGFLVTVVGFLVTVVVLVVGFLVTVDGFLVVVVASVVRFFAVPSSLFLAAPAWGLPLTAAFEGGPVGVGTIAAGVVKAYADLITVSGHDGGTGAEQRLRRGVGRVVVHGRAAYR